MSSYKDFIKKWNGEYIEPEQKTSSTKRESNASESAGYQRFIEKYNPTVDESYINSFLSDFNTYSSKAKSDYDSLNWNSATSSGLVKSYEDTSFDLAFRSGMIRSHLWLNKDSIDEQEYNNLVSRLDDIEGYSKDVTKAFTDARDYYSQWNTQKDYDDFVAYQKDYEAKKSFDISAGEKEVAELEGILSEYKKLTRFTTDENGARRADEIFQQYGDEKAIKALISQKKQYLNQAKRIQDGITLSGVVDNADFKENSGYSSTESDSKWGKLTSQYGLGYEDLTYEYINGAHNGMREEILYENRSYSIDTGLDTSENWKIYDNMTESEIAIYNYHYAKDGKEAAERYLKSIEETLNMREATSMYSNMEDNTALELAFKLVVGLDQFESGVENLFNTEDDYIPQSAYQIASGMVDEDLDEVGPKLPDWLGGRSLGRLAGDAISTTANMAPSILTSMAANLLAPGSGAIIGAGMMGASAAGNDYQQMLNLGYTKEQARMHSALVGASEAGLQYFLGGIGALGGKVSGGVLTKIMNGIDNAFLRTAIKLGGSMVSEGLEEGLQEILTTWFQNLVMYTDEDVDWSEVAYSSLLGALTAGFMEGPSTISGEVSVYNTGRQLQDADISAQRLAEIGSTFSADTVAYQLASRVDESTGAYTMGRLFNEIGATLTEQNVNDITEALVEKGMDRGTAKKNARAMAKIVEGGNLTDLQVAVIESNEVLAEAVRTTIIEQNATWFQRTKGYNDALMALAKEKSDPNATQTNLAQATEGNGEVGVDGISEADTGPSSVKSISDIKDGQVTIKLDNDSEVNLREADLDPDDGVTIETIASIAGISAADANFILNTLRTNPGASAQMASLGAKEAYKYGYYGFSKDHMTQQGVFANSLNETQRQAIYETGRKARASTVAAKQAVVAKNATVGDKNATTGKVHFDGDHSTLTERQSASLTAMEKVAEILGVQIHVFESEVNEKGKRIGANGWYDPDDNSIHIDLHAGANGDGTMMFTLAHELTHYIRKWSPEKFKILADFLMEEYGKKGVNIDALVRAQIEKAWATRKRKISYDTAYEEVVADSMEMMLADGNVVEKLAKLKQKDESLWQKIKDFISDLVVKIRAVYKGMTPDSVEGRYVADMVDAIEKLQDLFTDALVDASENYQASEQIGIEIDADTESVSPEVAFSERTWTESDYVQEREKAAAEIAKAIGVSKKKAKAYIDSVNSIAKMIAEDRVRLDYFSSPGRSSFVSNVEYGGSFDFSTLCKKRRLLTGTFTAIQRALPNTALTADEILDIRNRMKEKGLEVSCGLCYVEGSRANMGQFAKEFLRLYKKYYPDAWQPNMADVKTPDGIEWVRINHPECYEQYEYFWNHYGTLKDGDKNLFASQQKPKLYQLHTEYKGEILEKFKDDGNVENKNLNGGIRLQSFSDFEIVHLIDTMQIIMDMSRVGLAGQAYTKVPDFAWALGDTGLKINLSLIAKGVDKNGKLIFDDVEGMPIDTAVELRNRYSKNVGTILVAFNDEQLLAAMADDRVDYIIPFHRSQWKKSQYAAMGLPAKTKDYTYMQNEKFIKPQYHEYRGRMVQDKATNYMPNEYWDFSKSGKDNAIAYLEMCARNNKRPKFYKLLQNNGDGSYSLKADGSTDGYWKLLIDFKMYDNDGKGSPQMPVKPEFNMEEATRMLETYQGGHSNFPVAQGIVDDFVKDYKDSHKDVLYSDRDTVPTFYSHMAKVVDGVKQSKLGASSVVSMLRGKGVKAEEIKWSGIEEWLEGKKSVTKAELQEFIAGSMLQIEEETLTDKEMPYSQERLDQIAKYEAERDTIAENLKSEWKRIVGTDIPIRYFGGDIEHSVVDKLLEANTAKKMETEAGYKYKAAKAALQRCIEYSDHYFGFDNERQAFREAVRNPKDFLAAYEMTSFEESVFRDFIKAKEAYSKVDGIPMQDQKALKAIAESAGRFNRRIAKVKSEHLAEAAKHMTKWGQYTIKGGENYREVLFKMPGSSYYNAAMDMHWGERNGVLAHARIQDLNTFLGKMLFIEEIQSDWHNDGRKDGYASEEQAVRKKVKDLEKQWDSLMEESMTASATRSYAINEKLDAIDEERNRLESKLRSGNLAPDAPFKDTYHEYVLKRLLREAAENGYDSIGWTPAEIQAKRWSEKFAEGYRIEYDQEIPKFLNKYGKKWGTEVGKTVLDNGTEVWSMAITDEMMDSVMTEGQPLYSYRDTDGNQLSAEQQEFFKDSKVRDSDGNLIVLYHGTSVFDNIAEFRTKAHNGNRAVGLWLSDSHHLGALFASYMGDEYIDRNMETAEDAEIGNQKKGGVYKLYANLTNPFVVDALVTTEENYGGVVFKNYKQPFYHEIPTPEEMKAAGVKAATVSGEEIAIFAREHGYDGVIIKNVKEGYGTAVTDVIAFEPNQVKYVDNRTPTSSPDIRYSERDTESVSNRSLLANAFEGVAQSDIERNKIKEYKSKISLIESEERKLSDLTKKIKELSFAKGPRDTQAIRDLQFEAKQTANRINTYDKQLLRLEASKPLQDVLQREKKAAYQRAEKKGKEALEKYREKATKTQRELLTKWQDSRKKGIESREKTAMRHKIQRVVGELNQLLLNGDKNRHVPENMKKAVADALALVNMDTVGAEERAAKYATLIAKETDPDKIDAYTVTMENILRQGDKMGQRLKELRDAYEEIQGSDDPDIANAYDPVIAGALSELSQSIGNTSLRNMTLDQLSDVYDVYRMVLTRVRDANKAFLNEMRENISNLASRVIGEVRMAGGEHKYRAAILDPARKFLWNNLKPVYAMEHIGSTTLANVFDNVRAGEDVWAKDVTEARDYYLNKSKKYGYDSWDFKKKYRFESNDGTVFDLTLDQILSLYAYSKREQAHDHLRLGGFVFDSNIETYKEKGSKLIKYKVNTADAHQITPEILANIIGKLSDKQKAFVDEMQDYLSTTMGAKGNEVTMKMYGVKLFKEKFYFPLKSAKQFMFEQNQVSGEVKIKNSGFTNKVVAKANNPVILSNFMDVWSGHVNDMSMYHAFVLPLEDFNRVFNYNSPKKENQPSVSVKGTIQNSYSPAAVDYVKNLITDLNGGARGDSTTGFINKMMGLFKKGSVFASLSVVVQQPSAIARAVALVDTKYFIGPKVDHKSHKALWNEVKKYAPVAIIKEMGYFDTNMGKSTQDFIQGKEYSSIGSKMKALFTDSGYRDEALSKAPALADEIAWCSIWEAVKRETKAKHKSMNTKSDEFLKMAGKRFTEVIVKTQVYDSVLSRSANMRSKDTGMKMATAFMAEPTTSINMIADALLKGKRGNKKYARSAIGAVIASQILNSILVSFVYAGRDDDEDKTYLEKYIGTLAGQTLDSLNPAGYIPFIKDIMSIVQGYDVERSDMAVVSDLWKAWQDLQKDDVSVYRKVEGFVGSIAQIFGLPVKNIMRDARGIYQTIDSCMNGQQTTKAGIEYAVKSALPAWVGGGEASDQTQLYEAYINGDQEQIARVKGRYKDASAVSSAIRKALRENDPRIREAAIAWNANDLNKYMRIAKAIIAERHFSQDDVVMAIRAEANSLAPEKETSSTAKAKGLFTTEKFAEAIAKGDQATANAIKSDIINTAQKNGKTAEEAEKSFNSSASGDCKELFLEGKLSESKAINALVNYCGLEQEDAEKRVGEWAFQKEYGFYYSDRGDAYKNGAISKAELKDILMDVGGKTEEEAEWQIKVYDWQSEGYDVESTYVIQDYEEFCEPAGIDKGTYYDAYLFYKDAGETGVAYSKTIECVPYIDSLPLTSAQKTALALCWWAEATVRKYKTW